MKTLEIFDPALCCETGVCGTSIDENLLRIATVINQLKEKGIEIKRHGLSTSPEDFVTNSVITNILQKDGVNALPVTLLDGKTVKTREYPTNDELSKWLNVTIENKISNKCCCKEIDKKEEENSCCSNSNNKCC